MAQPAFNPFSTIVGYTKSRDRHKENAARLAHSFGTFLTTGWGEFHPEDAIEFDSPYLYRPSVSTGWSLETDDEEAKLRNTRYPRVTAGVVMWHQNNLGFYTGAVVAICVEDRSPFIEPTDPDPDPNYSILHDFTFLGIAMKDIPSPLRGDIKEV